MLGARRADAQEAAASAGSGRSESATGIPLPGRLVLRPSLTIGAGYDSNIFYQDTGTRQSATLSVSPQVSLGSEAQRRLNPTLSASVTYLEYLSDDGEIRGMRSLSAAAAAAMSATLSERLTLTAADNYTRVIMPPYQPGQRQFTSNTNSVSAGATLQPGGPRLKLSLGYSLTHFWYDEDAQRFANRHAHNFSGGGSWLVLPKTSVGINGDVGIVSYDETTKSGSYPLHLTGMAQTALTERLQLGARLGVGKGFYEKQRTEDDDATMFVLGFDAKYQSSSLMLSLLYSRDFQDSLWANYYAQDRVALQARRAITASSSASAGLSYDRRRFAPPPTPLTGEVYLSSERTDHVITLNLAADHAFSSRMTASLAYSLSANRSDFRLISDPNGAQVPNDVSYYKHGLVASLRVAY